MLAALAGLFLLIASGERQIPFGMIWDAGQNAGYFCVDLISLFLLMCVGLVTLASALTAFTTIDDHRSSYTNLLMVIMLGMNGMLLVRDLFSLYVFMEVTGVASFVLIGMYKSTRDLEGAFKYMTLSALATIFILTGLSFLFIKAGSLRFDALTPALFTGAADGSRVLLWGALILLVSGYCIKSGVAPFHSWLPDAYESADTRGFHTARGHRHKSCGRLQPADAVAAVLRHGGRSVLRSRCSARSPLSLARCWRLRSRTSSALPPIPP